MTDNYHDRMCPHFCVSGDIDSFEGSCNIDSNAQCDIGHELNKWKRCSKVDNDRRYIHELALDVLEKNVERRFKCGEAYATLANWDSANRPLLTDQASAVMEEVELTMQSCKERCGRREKHCDKWLKGERDQPPCPHARLRRAYEKGKRHEG